MNRIIVICIYCALGVLHALSQVTVEDCQRKAQENYPLIRQYDLVDKMTGLSLSNAAKAYLPQVTLSAQATYQSDVASFPAEIENLFSLMGVEMHGLNRDQYRVMLDVSQVIWDGGATKARREMERAEGEVSKQNIAVELYALGKRVNDLYFGILLLEEQLAQNNEMKRLLQENYNNVSAMVTNGVALPSDLDAVEVELLTTQQQRVQIESSLFVYRKMLAILVGDESIKHATLTKPAYTDVWMESGIDERPEMRLYNAQISRLDAQRQSINASVMPQFGAFAQGFYGNPGLNMFNDMVENRWSWNYIVGVRMQWNISSFYTRKNSLSKIEFARKQVENTRETFRFNTALKLSEEQQTVERLQKVAAEDDKIIALRTSIRQAAEAKLQNGVISVNDLLAELTKENNAKITRSIHEIELLKSIYDIKLTRNE